MKANYYIIELKGENGTHHTVKKVFSSMEKADAFLKRNCAYILTANGTEAVVCKSIVKVEMV